VIAIKDDMPSVFSRLYSFKVLQLIRDMLIKDWRKRLELVTKERVSDVILSKDAIDGSFEKSVDEILKMSIGHRAKFEELENLRRTKQELAEKKKEISANLSKAIDKCFADIKITGICNGVNRWTNFIFANDDVNGQMFVRNCIYEVTGDLKMGFPRSLFVLVKIIVGDGNYAEVDIFGMFNMLVPRLDLNSPLKIFQENIVRFHRVNADPILSPTKTITIFKGAANIDDGLVGYLKLEILKLIAKALSAVGNEVQDELKWQADIAISDRQFRTKVSSAPSKTIIDSL
jgi:hypothetical protein